MKSLPNRSPNWCQGQGLRPRSDLILKSLVPLLWRGALGEQTSKSEVFFRTIGKLPRGALPVCNAILTGSQPTFLPVPRDCGCEPSFFGLSAAPGLLLPPLGCPSSEDIRAPL